MDLLLCVAVFSDENQDLKGKSIFNFDLISFLKLHSLPGGNSLCTQQLTPGEKCNSTWNRSSDVTSLFGSSYNMITTCKERFRESAT